MLSPPFSGSIEIAPFQSGNARMRDSAQLIGVVPERLRD